jgi:hypothetical protein
MMLQLNPAFSERNFGCSQFKQFLDRATRATVVKLGERDTTSGEYAVLLTAEFDAPSTEARAVQSGREEAQGRSGTALRGESSRSDASGRRGSSRGRGASSREQAADATAPETAAAPQDATAEATTTPDVVTGFEVHDDTPVAPVASTPLSARSGLRRGRLRFSAKNGRSTVVPRNGAATGAEDASASTEETAGTDAPAVMGAMEDEPATNAGAEGSTADVASPAETLPTEASATETEAAAPTSELDGDVNTPVLSDGATAADATAAAPKKRATRGGRRRKTATKGAAEDAPAEDAVTETEGAAPTEAAPAETSAEAAMVEASDAAPPTDAAAERLRQRRRRAVDAAAHAARLKAPQKARPKPRLMTQRRHRNRPPENESLRGKRIFASLVCFPPARPASCRMTPSQLSHQIKERATQLGFAACGIAPAAPSQTHGRFLDWLARGHHASMQWIARDDAQWKRADVRRVMPEAKSVVCVAMHYRTDEAWDEEAHGKVARYCARFRLSRLYEYSFARVAGLAARGNRLQRPRVCRYGAAARTRTGAARRAGLGRQEHDAACRASSAPISHRRDSARHRTGA